jgi:putative protein kinase ArgK-like GTPase of G3E family
VRFNLNGNGDYKTAMKLGEVKPDRSRNAREWQRGEWEPAGSCRGQSAAKAPVLGITGTGGAGKSSVTDEIVEGF